MWLNSHGPARNGWAHDSSTGNPTVADLIAATAQDARTAPATSRNDWSVQIGWARRNRTGAASSWYQPTPYPSALRRFPWVMRGAYAWVSSEYFPS